MILGPLYQELSAPTQTGGVLKPFFSFCARKKRMVSIFQEKERGQGAYRCPEFDSKNPSHQLSVAPDPTARRSLRSAHRLSVQLHSKTNAFGPMRASSPYKEIPKIGRTICPPKFFLPFFNAMLQILNCESLIFIWPPAGRMGEGKTSIFLCHRTIRRIGAVSLRYAYDGRWAEARLVRRAESNGQGDKQSHRRLPAARRRPSCSHRAWSARAC